MIEPILHSLKIRGRCKDVKENRHFRTYDIELEPGQSLRKLENHLREIGLMLRSHSIPTMTTVPESGIVRLQITHCPQQVLNFDELFAKNISTRPNTLLPFLLGEDASGKAIWIDVATCPHILVAGSTGSGKSVFLHTLIANALKRDDVQLYLVDPKAGIEFNVYKNEANIIVNTYEESIKLLRFLQEEMEERYEKFQELGIRSISDCPFIVPKVLVIIDEVSDLMLQDQDKNNKSRGVFEKLLIQIAQKSRAVGIHLVLATQRPSVDVLTGLIKANFPARIACKVSSAIDSKVILDQHGAENLLGRGDALLRSDNGNIRFQVAMPVMN
jgi:S-DNA-T family DNA segregation ATPase FtsK/SpoIIIE